MTSRAVPASALRLVAAAVAGCALVVTCDCGTSDVDGIALARARDGRHPIPDPLHG